MEKKKKKKEVILVPHKILQFLSQLFYVTDYNWL